MIKKELKVSDVRVIKKALVFCCGHGLTSEALKQAGYKVLGGIDTSEDAQVVYELNYPDAKFLLKSLRELSVQSICDAYNIKPGELDLLQISNPCTDTSSTGEQVIFSATNDLYFVAARLAIQLQAKTIVFENVKALTHKEMAILLAMLNAVLQSEGAEYHIEARVLDSFLYGDPQSRSRIFIQMTRKDIGLPAWPIPVAMNDRRFIRDVIPTAEYMVSTNFGQRIYYPHEPAPTITAHPNLKVYDQDGERKVTPQELAGFMGLGENFQLTGTLSSQELGLGNGVCVGVMRALAETIKNQVLDSGPPGDLESNSLVELVEEQIEADVVEEMTQSVGSSLVESNITWTDHTWNPWTGCQKVSAGCKNCYMFRDEERWGKDPSIIKRTGDYTFNSPLRIKEPKMVFTCSYSDFFIEQADDWREDAWEIIRKTPHLTYQILTKRPERIKECLPSDWGEGYPNVWLGVTVENQDTIHRAELLVEIPASVRFISAEPLLGPLDLLTPLDWKLMGHIDWIIIGGESGNITGKYNFRECQADWIQQLINDMNEYTKTKVFVKQAGNHLARVLGMKSRHGSDIEEFPEWMKVQEWPVVSGSSDSSVLIDSVNHTTEAA
jgi:protein gp37/site-specific DNA-cytosine methylase